MVRLTALVASAGLVLLWGGLLWRAVEPGVGLAGGVPLGLAWLIFTGLALSAGVGAARRLPLVTLMCGFVSLVPLGLYFLVMPHPLFRSIGALDVVLVAAGVMGWREVARSAPESQKDADGGGMGTG